VKLLTDFLPLLLFFAAYQWYDIFVATAVAIAASSLQVTWARVRHGKVQTAHLVTLGAIVVFGGLTLLVRDDVFIKWKPTIVNWLFAAGLLLTPLVARRTALEMLLSGQLSLARGVWNRLNLAWALFFLFCGALNLYVAFGYGSGLDPERRTDIWVNFKTFGLIGLTVLFVIGQTLYLARHLDQETTGSDSR